MNYCIGKNCSIGDGVIIKNNTIIGDNVIIEDNVIIGKTSNKSCISNTTHNKQYNPTIIKNNTIIGAGAIIYMGSIINSDVFIADLATIRENVTIGEKTIIGRNVCVENNCSIGRKCKIQTNVYITAFSIIEDYVFIAPGVLTSNDNSAGRGEDRIKYYKGVTIKQGGRVGVGSVILPGIIIGEDSFIGAGSLVTKNIPDGELWYGHPAIFQRLVPESHKLKNQTFYDENSNLRSN